ncbi:MAG TPA: prepilin-type N-terminal cleavage/methylation domain-containing protein [Gemmatimonadales bacterium]|jgi:prepilin-type N-terminal cleavage/methylation domain-containing protein|nr:prepilin-type N-terminal cleavage/methylation domain-containing protein [Gemmatimonadales bacterium]
MTSRFGFTLLELVVVLVIVGLLTAVSVPRTADRAEENPAGAAASQVVGLLRSARTLALSRAEAVSVRLDPSTHAFLVTVERGDSAQETSRGALTIPRDVTLAGDTSGAGFRFAATGVAQGETLYVRHDRATVAVWVDRWTGAAHVRP